MRGYIFMLESVFAVLILVGFLFYIGHIYLQPSVVDHSFVSVLPDLDQKGLLRGYVYSADLEGLEGEITLYGFNHSVQICDSSGCTGQAPQKDVVRVSSYFLSGEDSYEPKEVKLYAWEE